MRFKSLLATVLIAIATVMPPAALMLAAGGCKNASQQRVTVNTIASTGHTVDAAFKAYLDLVVQGAVATNSVPEVSRSYSVFQSAYLTALTLSAMNTNALPSVELQNAASQTLLAIKAAKGGK